jgi:hypothetical protein
MDPILFKRLARQRQSFNDRQAQIVDRFDVRRFKKT